MALLLKQSTSVTISFGPAVLNSDGVTYVTNLVGTGSNQTENTSTGIRISKNGGALAARHATAGTSTYDAFGMYLVILDTTDTGTVGNLRVTYGNAAAFCPITQDFQIVPANIYDSIVGGTDVLDVSVIQLLGTAWLTPGTAGTPDVNAKLLGATAQTGRDIGASVVLAAGQKVDVDTIKTNPVVNGGTITFPTNATLASTTNVTGATLSAAYDAAKTAAQAGDAMTLTAAYNAAKTASQAGDAMALTGGERTTLTGVVLTTQGAESYRAKGAAPTLMQAVCELLAHLGEVSIASTTKTINGFDGVTAKETFTLDSATTPAAITRAT